MYIFSITLCQIKIRLLKKYYQANKICYRVLYNFNWRCIAKQKLGIWADLTFNHFQAQLISGERFNHQGFRLSKFSRGKGGRCTPPLLHVIRCPNHPLWDWCTGCPRAPIHHLFLGNGWKLSLETKTSRGKLTPKNSMKICSAHQNPI